MSDICLDVVVRDETGTGSARAVRNGGGVPAVLYGGGQGPVAVAVRKIMSVHGCKRCIHRQRSQLPPGLLQSAQLAYAVAPALALQLDLLDRGHQLNCAIRVGGLLHRMHELLVQCG